MKVPVLKALTRCIARNLLSEAGGLGAKPSDAKGFRSDAPALSYFYNFFM